MKFEGALKNVPLSVIEEYGFVILETTPEQGCWLNYEEDELFIEFAGEWTDIRLEFLKKYREHRVGRQKPFLNLLKKAFGKPKQIIDLTCGFAEDSLLLLFFGHKVQALERNPIMAALLKDALSRAREDHELGEIFQTSFDIHYCSAQEFIEKTDLSKHWLYFDPMFEAGGGKRSLPSKKMQFLSEIVGKDEDWEFVLKRCLESNAHALICKRSDKAAASAFAPKEVIKGKTVRFDKYLCAKIIKDK